MELLDDMAKTLLYYFKKSWRMVELPDDSNKGEDPNVCDVCVCLCVCILRLAMSITETLVIVYSTFFETPCIIPFLNSLYLTRF